MNSTFIRFVKDKNHLVDDITNGFTLRKHQISFKPSIYSILPSLIDFWKDRRLSSKMIDPLIDNYKKLNEQEFWKWYVHEMKNNQEFNLSISYIFAQINSAEIKMKCFTELRDNQKIHPNHRHWFGSYGISMSKEWMLENNGDRIVYVDSNSEVTNRIARLLSMLLSTFGGKDVIKSMFDILSFTEIAGNSHEYEWRIVGNHNFAGKSYGNYPDKISFSTTDIEGVFVEKEEDIETFVKILKDKSVREGSKIIPQLYISKAIFLTKDEIEQINNIKKRR